MIYTLNTRDFLLYPVMRRALGLTDQDVRDEILRGFQDCQERLLEKGIFYERLKGALIPSQDRGKSEICLVADSAQIDSDSYGYTVFRRLLPLLDRESTYSILYGDYLDLLAGVKDAQRYLWDALREVLTPCHGSRFQHSGQYFLIYFNRLSQAQRQRITEGLADVPWFTGYADLTHRSRFKTYLAAILTHGCVKYRDQVIVPRSEGCPDEEDVSEAGYPFEESGFSLHSLREESFGPFLSYKIESEVPDQEDAGFSLNALFPKFDSPRKLRLPADRRKWDLYLSDPVRGKGKLLRTIGYGPEDWEQFYRELYGQICANYIYNLDWNRYGDLLFNVCLDLPTVHGGRRKTTVALKYLPQAGEMAVITVT